MNILTHLKSGAVRSLKTWKEVLVIWLLVLALISLLALPMKSGLKSLFDSSMITELLKDTINIDVIADLKPGLISLLPAVTTGLLLVFFLGFLLNAFLTGGLFTIMSYRHEKQSVSQFFAGAADNFWSVLVITIILVLILLFSGLIIGGIPVIIVVALGTGANDTGSMTLTLRIIMIILVLLLPVMILVSDYARAWQAINDEKSPFKAIGIGFSTTFKTILKSYPLMLILMVVQSAFGVFVMSKILSLKPSTGGGVFLLFTGSQLLFIIRILLRVWRYGCVSSLMEDWIASEKVVS